LKNWRDREGENGESEEGNGGSEKCGIVMFRQIIPLNVTLREGE